MNSDELSGGAGIALMLMGENSRTVTEGVKAKLAAIRCYESQRLESVPGIGVISATAITATVTDPHAFKSGRDLAAWIGLVPRQHSTGGKQRLGGITRAGDERLTGSRYLWLTKEEVAALSPAKAEVGQTYPLPAKVAERIASIGVKPRYLTKNSRSRAFWQCGVKAKP